MKKLSGYTFLGVGWADWKGHADMFLLALKTMNSCDMLNKYNTLWTVTICITIYLTRSSLNT